MPSVNVNGETINYVMEGQGPVVAFIHFLGAFSYQWRHQIERLKDRYTCLAFDCRGFGHSSYNGRWEAQTVAQDLHGLLTALDVDKAHIVGFSMGGPVALSFSADWPGMVRSLTLIDTFARNHTHSEGRLGETELCFRYMSLRQYARQYAATRLLPRQDDAAFEELVSAICLSSKSAYLDVLKGILIPDFTDLCGLVRVPTLVVCGQHDKTTPVEFSRNLTELIPGASEIIIGTGHLGSLDDPEVFTQPIEAFLDSQHQAK